MSPFARRALVVLGVLLALTIVTSVLRGDSARTTVLMAVVGVLCGGCVFAIAAYGQRRR